MPKIDVNKKIFSKIYPYRHDKNSLERYLPYAKAEWDDSDSENIKIELNDTNRPDLWSAVGLARCLNNVRKNSFEKYNFFSNSKVQRETNGREFIVDSSFPESRPYSVGFCAKGVKIDDDILKLLIQFQEKIHANYGRKRKTISMGLYRYDKIKFPVHYTSALPEDISFTPLHCDKVMNGFEVLENTEKGVEFAHLLKGEKTFPLLKDASGGILSMPPIINSNDIGALEVGDEHIFVEVSGLYLKQILLVCNMLACDMADLGFEIEPVRVKFASVTEFGDSIVVPYYFQKSVKCTKADMSRILGRSFRLTSAIPALRRMGVEAEKSDVGVLKVYPAPYRNDYLHPCDVVEDIAIGYGLEKLGTEPIKDWTIGRLQPSEVFARKVRGILVGLGYNEMIFNYLSSKKEYVDNMNISDENIVYIENPMSENYKVVRPSVIPSLLKSESVSQSSVFPHLIFEVGKTCIKSESGRDGVKTSNTLGALESSSDANYNKCVSTLNVLMFYLGIKYSLKAVDDSRFIKGRSAFVIVNEEKVGIIGEIAPEVLENWGILMPCCAIEVDIDALL